MKNKFLFIAMGNIDEKYIDEDAEDIFNRKDHEKKRSVTRLSWLKLAAPLAACLIIAVAIFGLPNFFRNPVDSPVVGNTTETPDSNNSENFLEAHYLLAVFVNDTYYQFFADQQSVVPELDKTWKYIGDIQSASEGLKAPTINFQASFDMIGAKIYHSYKGRIPVTNSIWGDTLDEEVIGDSIIVVFEGKRYLYITGDAWNEAYKIMESVEMSSLLVDGVMYILRGTASGGEFSLNDDYVFLGEVESAVSLYELPTENFQANREYVVGKRVYMLPSGEINDIVVLINEYSGRRCYYSALVEK
jgi:hypothetical protein